MKATYDFRSPVLDFIQAEDRPGHFWVLVDVAYGAETHVLSRPVRFIRWDGAEVCRRCCWETRRSLILI